MSPVDQTESSVWTTRRLLTWTTQHLAHKGVDHPRLSAEMLLSHVLGVTRLKLYMDPDRPANELERAAFRELVERAGRHEPVDYLVGQTPFFSMMLKVTPDVLVPRPSTEALVEHVVQHAKRTPGFGSPLVADVGTGSGAIAVAIARSLPTCRVIATDVSEAALKVAAENAAAQGVADRVDLRRGSMLEPLGGDRVQYLVSNPPYLSDQRWRALPRNVKQYEPTGALRGGVDGLKFLRLLIERGPRYLATPGQLVLEIDEAQKEAVLTLVKQVPGLTNPHVLSDHEGLPRVLVADNTISI